MARGTGTGCATEARSRSDAAVPEQRYEFLGTSDEHTDCAMCGRTDLKHTVACRELATGNTVYFGSECAETALGWRAEQLRMAAQTAQRAAHEEQMAESRRRSNEDFAHWQGWLERETGLADVGCAADALGGFTAAQAIYHAAYPSA